MAETTIIAEPKKGTPAKKVAAKVEVKKEVVEEPLLQLYPIRLELQFIQCPPTIVL